MVKTTVCVLTQHTYDRWTDRQRGGICEPTSHVGLDSTKTVKVSVSAIYVLCPTLIFGLIVQVIIIK